MAILCSQVCRSLIHQISCVQLHKVLSEQFVLQELLHNAHVTVLGCDMKGRVQIHVRITAEASGDVHKWCFKCALNGTSDTYGANITSIASPKEML